MDEALTAEAGPQTDTLQAQTDLPKPVEKPAPEPKSMDETLREAVEKATKPADKPEAPKEPVKDEPETKAKPVKDDAAKRQPDEETDDEPNAPKQPDDDGTKAKARPTAYKDAPNGFDDAAKAEWEAVPESVRGAFHRRTQEMERGIHKYRQDAEQFDTVRQFAEQAQQSGTDLPSALRRYTQMEQTLRQDPMAGLQAVVANLDLKKPDGSPVTLRDVAASIMGQTPDQAASRQEATINRLTQQLQEVTQQLGGFSKHVETQQTQARTQAAESEWTGFQRENPRATELEPQIAEFLTKYPADKVPVRERLQDAYNWAAAQMPPSVAHTDPEPLVQTQAPVRQPNPAGQKSISGVGGESRNARKQSSDDALRAAIARTTR